MPCLTTSQGVIDVIVQNSIILQPEKPPIDRIDSQESGKQLGVFPTCQHCHTIDSRDNLEIYFSPTRKPPIDKIDSQESQFNREMVWRRM